MEIEKGKKLNIKTLAVGDLDEKTGEREVFFDVNGYLRSIMVEDKATTAVSTVSRGDNLTQSKLSDKEIFCIGEYFFTSCSYVSTQSEWSP